ncbi:DUF1493 family protein [Trinickia violacea]|uniref:DUF1493 family protein n=1 Tax=Trinickia violacea TaxID=2571746 RepID=A0A4P8IW73_9BURK|nr:DUF1493 family protein [Trinickia violacea]QCP51424.1 DUF1493 family protein [Trinickia violacea]
MEDDTWVRIEAFAREEIGQPLFRRLTFTPETRLDEDAGLAGVDAIEFIDKWALTFDVAAQGFPYDRYFSGDGFDLAALLLCFFPKRFRDPPLVPITLGMLAEATRRGRWDTQEIEAWAKEAN